MVLQQGIEVPVWGTTIPNTEVTIQLGEHRVSTVSDLSGKWIARLPKMGAAGPFDMMITADETIILKNVMIGEVWLASGQSNMEWSMKSGVINTEQEIAAANYPDIRFFQVPKNVNRMPKHEINGGEWIPCSPSTVGNMSAVAYFFAMDLWQQQNVAVGIIQSFWGGTVCEAWTSQEMLANLEDFVGSVKEIRESDDDWEALQKKANQLAEARSEIERTSRMGIEKGVYKIDFNDTDWTKTQYPINMWHMGLNWYWGFVWLRKWIDIPAEMAGKPAMINLGKIAFEDITWFNGVKIGSDTDQGNPREYEIPGKLVKEGKNLIAVRILSRYGAGKIGTASAAPHLHSTDSSINSTISLGGEWLYNEKYESEFPLGTEYQNRPSALYNAMISPLIPYGIKGVIWYQGESNADRAFQYRSLFPAMINDWRARWNQGDFPFLFVQLANYEQRNSEPVESDWAELREAQLMTLKLPNTGMAVSIDVGDAEDIHPRNKKPVGQRLYLAARKVAYYENIVYSGPLYHNFRVENDAIRIFFTNAGKGLKGVNNEPVKGFSIAGLDKKFYWANAEIQGNTVVVKSPMVSSPVAVRYAWGKNPNCNLYNKEGLPASPFRTDSWKGITK
ncbi:MAG: sialate O-acetylesterase [Prolixibacteraceae bacterium]|nr:sialate O-acetylesterase [Prolixibacteraceae bacterium]